MKKDGRRRSWQQRERRVRREENAFLFDAEFTRCLGTVPREQWEGVIAICNGDIPRAAGYCGVENVPAGARALWGSTAEEALAAYKKWRQQAPKGEPKKSAGGPPCSSTR